MNFSRLSRFSRTPRQVAPVLLGFANNRLKLARTAFSGTLACLAMAAFVAYLGIGSKPTAMTGTKKPYQV